MALLYICSMKVVIPMAGTGKHLRPHTYSQPKPLIPIAGKPLIRHIVDNLVEAGFKEYIFVLGYLGEKARQYLLTIYGDVLQLYFVQQEPRLGLAHAIAVCKNLIEAEAAILIVLGDTLLQMNWQAFTQNGVSRLATAKVEKPSLFGIAEVDSEGRIRHLVEKPIIPRSNLALAGAYYVQEPARLLAAIQYLMDNHLLSHGEYQLTDALERLIREGQPIYAYMVEHWLDCERKEALLEANRLLLRLDAIEDFPTYPETVIIPPVYIPPSCKLHRAIIGPYVTLGEGVEIQNAIIQDSIVGAYARIQRILLRSSVIGGEATIQGHETQLNLGDHTDIEL